MRDRKGLAIIRVENKASLSRKYIAKVSDEGISYNDSLCVVRGVQNENVYFYL